jgi:hypothetical protein
MRLSLCVGYERSLNFPLALVSSSGASPPGFHSWDSVQAELLEIPGQRVHEAALVSIELAQPSWILSGLRIVLDDVNLSHHWKTMSHVASLAITSTKILSR